MACYGIKRSYKGFQWNGLTCWTPRTSWPPTSQSCWRKAWIAQTQHALSCSQKGHLQQRSTNPLICQTKCFFDGGIFEPATGFVPWGLLEIESFRPLAAGKPTDKKTTGIAVKRWVVPLWLQQRNARLKIETESSKQNVWAVFGTYDQRVKIVVCRVWLDVLQYSQAKSDRNDVVLFKRCDSLSIRLTELDFQWREKEDPTETHGEVWDWMLFSFGCFFWLISLWIAHMFFNEIPKWKGMQFYKVLNFLKFNLTKNHPNAKLKHTRVFLFVSGLMWFWGVELPCVTIQFIMSSCMFLSGMQNRTQPILSGFLVLQLLES